MQYYRIDGDFIERQILTDFLIKREKKPKKHKNYPNPALEEKERVLVIP